MNANEEEEANGDKVEVDGEEEVGEASEDEQDAGDMRKMKKRSTLSVRRKKRWSCTSSRTCHFGTGALIA